LNRHKNGALADLKMLEIFEIECINPPKLPDIPSESQILRRKEKENRKK
jgi:hypothetical protein